MNTHPTEFIPGYVLGALDDRERQVVARHLAICPQCRREAESFYISVESPRCAPHALPAGGVKHRLMLRVHASALARATMGRSPWRGWAVAAALLLAIVGVSVGHSYYTAIHAQGQVDAFLRDPHTLRRPLPGLSGGQATLYLQPGQRRALLEVTGLPPLRAGSIYQIWFAHGRAPVASATFAVDAGGAATVLCDTPDPIAETYSQVMVTVEPAGGSATPSGEPLFSATLAARPGVLRPVAQLFALDQVGNENQRLTLLITVRYDT